MSEETILDTTPSTDAPEATVTAETQAAPVEAQAPAVESPASTNIDFSELLSEDIRSQSNLKDFKSADDLAKSYVELQRLVGNSIRIPSEDASPEAKADFLAKLKDIDGVLLKDDEKLYEKLGRPENIDGYKVDDLITNDLLESVPNIDSELDQFKAVALDIGLNNEQAAKLVEYRLNGLKAFKEQRDQSFEQGTQELKKLWGSDFDNRADAARKMIKLSQDKHGQYVDQLIQKAGDNPVLMDMFAELAESYKEKGHTGLSKANFGLTPEMAVGKISEKRGDRGFMEAYNSQHHPGHKAAVEELQRLYMIANGQQT